MVLNVILKEKMLSDYNPMSIEGRTVECLNPDQHLAQYPRALMEEWKKELNAC